MSQVSSAPPLDDWAKLASEGNFEEVSAALESVVDWLERGGMPLDISIQCYESGVLLSERCTVMLRDADLRISEIETRAFPGRVASLSDDDL